MRTGSPSAQTPSPSGCGRSMPPSTTLDIYTHAFGKNKKAASAGLIFAERKSAAPKESHPKGGSLLVRPTGFEPAAYRVGVIRPSNRNALRRKGLVGAAQISGILKKDLGSLVGQGFLKCRSRLSGWKRPVQLMMLSPLRLPSPVPCKHSAAVPMPFGFRLSVPPSHRFALPANARSTLYGFVPPHPLMRKLRCYAAGAAGWSVQHI